MSISTNLNQSDCSTYHFPSKKLHLITVSQRQLRGLDISKQNMGLPAHFGGFDGGDVEDWTVGGEEHVQVAFEVVFLQFFGEIGNVEGLGDIVVVTATGRRGGERHCRRCGGVGGGGVVVKARMRVVVFSEMVSF
jgi:hypothetical protein